DAAAGLRVPGTGPSNHPGQSLTRFQPAPQAPRLSQSAECFDRDYPPRLQCHFAVATCGTATAGLHLLPRATHLAG
ncbi:MAG: hypothetical protein ACKOJF_08330, partial [Planctomycetaceae bacterium]